MATPAVVFRHGSPLMVDHTPSGADVAAGDVVVVTDGVRIAHNPISDGALGALAAGGGVYDMPKEGGAGVTFTDGDTVYWDDTNDVCVATDGAGANKRIGLAVGAAADAATVVRVHHSSN